MNAHTSFSYGLRIGDQYYGPYQRQDDEFVSIINGTVKVYGVEDALPARTYTVPPGTQVWIVDADGDGEHLVGTV
jgi:hypothetical protein